MSHKSLNHQEIVLNNLDQGMFYLCRLTQGGMDRHLGLSVGLTSLQLRREIASLMSIKRTEDGEPVFEEYDPENLEDLSRADFEQKMEEDGLAELERCCTQVWKRVDQAIRHPDYLLAVQEYEAQEKTPARRHFPHLNNFLGANGYHQMAGLKSDDLLYHGIQMSDEDELEGPEDRQRLFTPERYFQRILGILESGLMASSNFENYPNLESVFVVGKPIEIYGIVSLAFPRGKEKILCKTGNDSEGLQIVRPLVKPAEGFQLFLRSPEFYRATDLMETLDVFGVLSPSEYNRYLKKIIFLLKGRNIPAKIIKPDNSVQEI